ncbi:MAG: hypothetical protein DDT25_00706 [Chloroflexi bacterium]|nr:hypothetical protein [Chloroflexota bacterium]
MVNFKLMGDHFAKDNGFGIIIMLKDTLPKFRWKLQTNK